MTSAHKSFNDLLLFTDLQIRLSPLDFDIKHVRDRELHIYGILEANSRCHLYPEPIRLWNRRPKYGMLRSRSLLTLMLLELCHATS